MYKNPLVASSLSTFSTSYFALEIKKDQGRNDPGQPRRRHFKDKNPIDTAVRLCLKFVPLQFPACWYAPYKRLLPGLGCGGLRESVFPDYAFAPQLTHSGLPLIVLFSFIWFLFRLCCNPWDWTLQNALFVPYLYCCCLVPFPHSVLLQFFTHSWFLDLPRWRVLTFRWGFWMLLLVLVPQGPMLATVAPR